MIKRIQNILLLLVVLCSFLNQLKAQLIPGTIVKDFNLKDLNGNQWNLYSLLNQGKSVVIFPYECYNNKSWDYHELRVLDTLFLNYGPAATKELVVFDIETDVFNTHAQLTGVSDSTLPLPLGLSAGNWINGVKYPIIDLDSASADVKKFYRDYELMDLDQSEPIVMFICPDKKFNAFSLDSVNSVSLLYGKIKNNCHYATAALDAAVSYTPDQFLYSCDSVIPTIQLQNICTSPLTSCTISYLVDGVFQKKMNWIGSITTYNSVNVKGPKLGAIVGSHKITAIVSLPNGGNDTYALNDSIHLKFDILPTTGGPLLGMKDFSDSLMPKAWLVEKVSDLPAFKWSLTTMSGPKAPSIGIPAFLSKRGDIHRLYLSPQSFVSLPTPGFYFDMAKSACTSVYNDSLSKDNLKIKVSTDCGLTWTTVYNKTDFSLTDPLETTTHLRPDWDTALNTYHGMSDPADSLWRRESVNLSGFSGKSAVLVMFEFTANMGDNIFIDNINFVNNFSIKEHKFITSVNLYPNPASNVLNIDIGLTQTESAVLQVYNNLGELVMSESKKMLAGDNHLSLSLKDLPEGFYTLNILLANEKVSKKLVKTK